MAQPGDKKKVKKNSKPKGQYRHGDLKRVLLAEALRLIETRRDVQFTLREVSQAAGVTHAAAYRHFGSKREILAEIALEGFKKLSSDFEKSLAPSQVAGKGSAQSLGKAYILFAVRHQAHFRVMFHPDLKEMSEFQELTQVAGHTFLTLAQCMAENQQQGRYGRHSTQDLTVAAWSIVHGLSTLLINDNFSGPLHKEQHNVERSAEIVVRLMEEGFLKRH